MNRRWIHLLTLALAAMALSGCTGDDPDEPDDAMDDSMDDAMDDPGAGGGTGGTGSSSDEPAFEPRWHNETGLVGLVDCTLLGQLIGAGAPVDALSQHIEVPLQEQDWNGTYTVDFLGDALSSNGAPASPAYATCVGFSTDDTPLTFAHGASGTVPFEATTMYVGGDLLLEADLAIYFEPEGYIG